ncbi:MAG: hypothetical protein K6C94_06420 [Candidatus Gastranaerophilales bacterium]|nr:hypothetical protein [Candidatus Gastranaerophilales bacterium]
MYIFLCAVLLLVLGYIFYGKFVEKVFGIMPEKATPAIKYSDGVDFVALPVWKVFLIQFLNIAGLGPVFGAVLGAVYGPVALLWIVFGSIFAGGVHDYMTGMFSVRFKGKTMDFMVKKLLHKKLSVLFALFLALILVLVGAVFALNPAKMLADIFNMPLVLWCCIIFGYYFLTTVLPVDKVIGKFYPFFAALLIGVTIALLVCLFGMGREWFAEPTFANLHPANKPIFPLMFITIACGALSGFHSTQSPIMARCLTNEKDGRVVFYGTMILEGFIALVWATLGIAFYQNQGIYYETVTKLGQGGVIGQISTNLLGHIGGILTILSVVVLSVTSGDTAFRSARLTLAEVFKINQKNLLKRFVLSACILSVGIFFTMVDITTLWMYFGWTNQTLAMISLWTASIWLKKKNKCYLITLLPALFMTMVSLTYILSDKIGFRIDLFVAKIISVVIAAGFLALFFVKTKTTKNKSNDNV